MMHSELKDESAGLRSRSSESAIELGVAAAGNDAGRFPSLRPLLPYPGFVATGSISGHGISVQSFGLSPIRQHRPHIRGESILQAAFRIHDIHSDLGIPQLA